MVKLTFDEERVPLRQTEGGTVFVGNSKVALEGIISAYWQGYTPEEIQWCFDPISLGDAYSVIAYYLHRKDEVDEYMGDYEGRWDRFVTERLAQPGAREFNDRLQKIRRLKEMEHQVGQE